MKRIVFFAVAVVLALSGCGTTAGLEGGRKIGLAGFDPGSVTNPNPQFPNIFVVGSPGHRYLVVDQEPVVIRGAGPKVQILWALPNPPGTYKFDPQKGIEIMGYGGGNPPANLRCQAAGPDFFTCMYDKPQANTRYKYSIKVLDGDVTLQLDPTIMNE